jgi:dUTP pyrophosphatase
MYTTLVDLTQTIKVLRLNKTARLPTRGSAESAGLDIYPVEEIDIEPLTTKLVRTGLAIQLPIGTFGLLTARSKASLQGFLVIPGIIDQDYTREIYIQIFNKNKEAKITTALTSPVAQIIPIRYSVPIPIEVQSFAVPHTRKLAFNLVEDMENPQPNEGAKHMYT